MIESHANWISVREWAERAGVSVQRARQLARHGKVPARRLGGVWMLDGAAAGDYPKHRGRPLSARSAWAAIDVLEGREPKDVSRSERLRARQRARCWQQLAPGQLSERAALRSFHAHPGVLNRLDADPRLVIGGARAAGHHGADLIALDDREFYIRQSDAARLIRAYGLRDASGGDANVKLRISDRLPMSKDRVVSAGTAAVDLLDAGDERSVRAARKMLADLNRPQSAS